MLGIILINYKNADEIISFVENELSHISVPYVTVVVDNSCDGKEVQKLKEALENNLKKTHIVDAKGNWGYAKGNNIGYKFLKKYYKEIENVLFSNSDIEFRDTDVVDVLVDKLDTNTSIPCISPRVLNTKGDDQNPHQFVTFFDRYILAQLLYPLKFIRLQKSKSIVPDAKSGFYDWVVGCFFIMRSSVFEEVGMFDEHTFLYAEEIILGRRMEQKGYRPYYFADKTILHLISNTIGSHYSERKKAKLIFESEKYYYNTYRGIPLPILKLGSFSLCIYHFVFLKLIILKKKILR